MNRGKTAVTVLLLTACLAGSALGAETATLPGPVQTPLTIEVNGSILDVSGKAPYLVEDLAMVPVRAVAEALGYTVTWTAQRSDEVLLDNGTVKTTLTLGQDLYFMASSTQIGMSKPSPLGAAPVATDAVTFVPMSLFSLLGNGAQKNENTISFSTQKEDVVQIPNPMKEYATVELAAQAAGLTLGKMPAIPSEYGDTTIYVIGDNLLSILYRNGEAEICYRVAQGSDDVSGDYTVYPQTDTQTIGTLSVTTKGADDTVSLATWQADNCTFSLHFDAPVTVSALRIILGEAS